MGPRACWQPRPGMAARGSVCCALPFKASQVAPSVGRHTALLKRGRNQVHALRSRARQHMHVRAGLFDFLGPSSPKIDSRGEELVDELVETSRKTNGGSKASQSTRDLIEQLAEDLTKYRIRAPTRSDLFIGTWQILYCSNPRAPGGPVLRSLPGQAIFSSQRLLQTLERPDIFLNKVEFKTLGVFGGSASQPGKWKALDGNSYKVIFEPSELRVAGGSPPLQQQESGDGSDVLERIFDVLYLDARVRVVRFLKEDDPPVLFVFERVESEEEDEKEGGGADEEDEEKEEAPPPKGLFAGFGARGKSTGELVADAQQQTARPLKAQKADPEKAAEAQRRDAVQKQLDELTREYKQRQEAARAATAELRDAERDSADALRGAGSAQNDLSVAEETAEAADQLAAEAQERAQAARQELQDAVARLREAERSLR